jgi:hypothetical protein
MMIETLPWLYGPNRAWIDVDDHLLAAPEVVPLCVRHPHPDAEGRVRVVDAGELLNHVVVLESARHRPYQIVHAHGGGICTASPTRLTRRTRNAPAE